MNRFDKLTKRLSAAIVSLLVTALFLQGCSGPVKMIGHTARLIMTETAEGRETDDPEQTETAPAPQENRGSAEDQETAAEGQGAGQDKASEEKDKAPKGRREFPREGELSGKDDPARDQELQVRSLPHRTGPQKRERSPIREMHPSKRRGHSKSFPGDI